MIIVEDTFLGVRHGECVHGYYFGFLFLSLLMRTNKYATILETKGVWAHNGGGKRGCECGSLIVFFHEGLGVY